MIKADPGLMAHIAPSGDLPCQDVPIVAWNDDGHPLVVNWVTGCLAPLSEVFAGRAIESVYRQNLVRATIPGAGWRFGHFVPRKSHPRGEEWYERAVMAFEIHDDGRVTVVTVGLAPNGGMPVREMVVSDERSPALIPPDARDDGSVKLGEQCDHRS